MQRVMDFRNSRGAEAIDWWQQLAAGYHQFLAHDLANQQVAIQGMARLLRDCTEEDERRLLLTRLIALTQRADQQARRLAELGRLLREARQPAVVDLGELVAETIAEVKVIAAGEKTRTIDIVADVVQHPLTVSLSRSLLAQVLRELLHNARVAPGVSRVVVRVDDHLLTVQDNGGAMSETVLGRLGTVRAGELGWFFIRQVLAQWRGRACISIEPGLATTISIHLPEKKYERSS